MFTQTSRTTINALYVRSVLATRPQRALRRTPPPGASSGFSQSGRGEESKTCRAGWRFKGISIDLGRKRALCPGT